MMELVLLKIADLLSKWCISRMTGQLTVVIDFNQGGIRNIDVTEKTRIGLK